MPQLGLLIILVLIPLQILSSCTKPRESMPELVQQIMLVAPTTHWSSKGGKRLERLLDGAKMTQQA